MISVLIRKQTDTEGECDDKGRDRNDSLQAQTYSYHQELGRGKEVIYPGSQREHTHVDNLI